ncbi:MarR family winged helix-turn-helix transcriptional regulator [uncultured Megasphaera sp.]|uniref:MarR family winged helix-turn-helix transcriptional regulator n=1 Tax=uncultured Megasphaera sp. TaxID=165188 RepID=UPI0025915640|nr:MarR family transcriptional regulator [uncultured Megasphaera sp.]
MIDDETQKFDEALLHQIFVTMRLFTKAINDTIKRYNVYSSEWSVLRYLINHPSVSQTAIATALQIEPAAISKTLAKMEKRGLFIAPAKKTNEKNTSPLPNRDERSIR